MSEPSTSPEPLPTTKKRPTRAQRTDLSYADADHPVSSDGDNYGLTENEVEELLKKKKKKKNLGKKAGKKAFLGKKAARPIPLVFSRPSIKLNPPREPAIELSTATTNLNHLYKNLHRFSINQDARFEYTPAEERTKHVLDCAVHDNRDFKLVGEPTLGDTTVGEVGQFFRVQRFNSIYLDC
jgi:hypothetical protein